MDSSLPNILMKFGWGHPKLGREMQLTSGLDFFAYMDHDNSSADIESKGRRGMSNVKAKMCALHEYLLRRPVSIG